MEAYFNYFTEIEEHFQRRRGTLLLLSPLDWALMETWKDAGIPLEAVLRGIDVTFEKWERRPRKTRKVNGLAFCAQEVLASAEELKEAAVGSGAAGRRAMPGSSSRWLPSSCSVMLVCWTRFSCRIRRSTRAGNRREPTATGGVVVGREAGVDGRLGAAAYRGRGKAVCGAAGGNAG